MAMRSELLAEDARQYQPGSGAISGEYRGRDAILAFYARLASETNGTFRVVLEGVYTDGEGRVVASSQTTAQRGDRRLDTGAALVFTIKDGKARMCRVPGDLDVWNDFWSLRQRRPDRQPPCRRARVLRRNARRGPGWRCACSRRSNSKGARRVPAAAPGFGIERGESL
jgi:ketosteroid isomerase-like protein